MILGEKPLLEGASVVFGVRFVQNRRAGARGAEAGSGKTAEPGRRAPDSAALKGLSSP